MARRYAIKEVFPTLQGEGAQAGTPAVFLRFAGCNLGYEVCPWCDTDWVKAAYTLDLKETVALVEATARAGFGGEREGCCSWPRAANRACNSMRRSRRPCASAGIASQWSRTDFVWSTARSRLAHDLAQAIVLRSEGGR